jgi:hypothetical protein
MAIERKKPIAFDDVEMSEEVVDPAAETIAAAPEEAAETATLSIAMLGGQKVAPGDVVRLEVVDVSDEDGTVQVKYSNPKSGGVAKAAAAFNEGV